MYGPPGCGKTLMARQIGKMLDPNGPEPKVINGPQLKNKFVGQGAENVRNLFADAEKDLKEHGDEAALHVIILDEIDALCKKRGSGDDAGGRADDDIVNQLLTKIDGVDAIENVLLIGMTNRKDVLDEAIIRPGRLECHLEISLPDEAGRADILKIHLKDAIDAGRITKQAVEGIPELACRTTNFTGAELASAVNLAVQNSLERCMTSDSGQPRVRDLAPNPVISLDDLIAGIEATPPQFGLPLEDLHQMQGAGLVSFGSRFENLQQSCRDHLAGVLQDSNRSFLSLLLHGPSGSGKTAFAASLAETSGWPFVRCIRPLDFVGLDPYGKMRKVKDVFDEAARSVESIVILDEIEELLNYSNFGGRVNFDHLLLQTLTAYIKRRPRTGHRLIILGTTCKKGELEPMGLFHKFQVQVEMPALNICEISAVMQEEGVDELVRESIVEMLRKEAVKPVRDVQLILSLASRSGAVTKASFVDACESVPEGTEWFF